MQENRRIQGHLFGAFSVLVWGTTFVSTKVLLRAFTPLEIMVARFTLGFLVLLIVGLVVYTTMFSRRRRYGHRRRGAASGGYRGRRRRR